MNVNVTLRNPIDKQDQITYTIKVNDTPLAKLWYTALNELLQKQNYLEKNFCFLGFPDTARNLTYICKELEWAKQTINSYFADEYNISEVFNPENLFVNLKINHDLMNKLHLHFENLQGTVNNLSEYYRRADYKTKFAIRQLNNLCHEAESLMLSLNKKITAPDWIRPSQITTFLNAHRYSFPNEYKNAFNVTHYNRKFGEVYLHWAQIGKTIFEVFRDEDGADIDQSTCSTITHLKYYTGEFDIEWGRDLTFDGPFDWYRNNMLKFKTWCEKNKFDLTDSDINFGYHAVGQVLLEKSFGTTDYNEIMSLLSSHLDIINIYTNEASATYNYNWTDENHYSEQIKMLIPGYDHSTKKILR